MRASERLAWAADVVAPRAGERVLEVGCGHGVLVDLLAGRGAEIVGVDRSAAMTAATTRRNAAAVAAGRVRVVSGSLVDVDPGGPFDAVVSFDVRAFWTPPAPEWDVVARVLGPGGRTVVAFSVMDPAATGRVEDAVRSLAAARGLVPAAVHRAATAMHASVAVELRRPPSPG